MKNDNELEKLLTEWFESNKNNIINKPHFWNRNKIANLIRKYVSASKKWNNKRRGNPEKGWAKLKEKEAQKDLEKRIDF
jgi:hypothetical protein